MIFSAGPSQKNMKETVLRIFKFFAALSIRLIFVSVCFVLIAFVALCLYINGREKDISSHPIFSEIYQQDFKVVGKLFVRGEKGAYFVDVDPLSDPNKLVKQGTIIRVDKIKYIDKPLVGDFICILSKITDLDLIIDLSFLVDSSSLLDEFLDNINNKKFDGKNQKITLCSHLLEKIP